MKHEDSRSPRSNNREGDSHYGWEENKQIKPSLNMAYTERIQADCVSDTNASAGT
jgi:hypothetical protein